MVQSKLKSSSQAVGDIRKYLKEKSSLCNRKSFTSMLNSPFCFLSEQIFLTQNLFLYFPEFFWGWACITFSWLITFFLAEVELNRLNPNFMFIFSMCLLSFYDEWWKIYFTMKLFEFVAPFSVFLYRKFSPQKKSLRAKKGRPGRLLNILCTFN